MSADILTPSTGIKLRPYQGKAVSRIFDEFDSGVKATLAVMATGVGKTTVFSEVAKITNSLVGGRVLILAHRGELIEQAASRLFEHGVECAIEKAEQQARASIFGDPMCVVASVQTMQGKRLRSWPRGHFKLVITDEAHHRPATSYCNVLDWLRPDWELGVTATADRADKDPILGKGQVYETLAFEYSIVDAVKDPDGPFLVPVEGICCPTDIDLSNIRTTAGDLNEADLAAAIGPHISDLVKVARPHMEGGRSIVFTPDVGCAGAVASALCEVGIPADWIHGDTPNRYEVLQSFREGHTRALCNCQLLTEGFDAPFVSRVVLMRATESRALQTQMIGRGTRLYPGKTKCYAIGFNWKTFKHKLVHPVELVDSYATDAETLSIAKELIDKGEEPDLLKAIEKAEEVKKERVKLRIKVREGETRYKRVVRFDPLAVADVLGMTVRNRGERPVGIPASAKQVETLEKFGIQGADKMSKAEASKYLDKIFGRLKEGLATVKQVSWMIARGVDPDEARAMSKDEASETLDRLFGKRAG